MYKTYLTIAAVLAILAVALGAFGAHGIKSTVTPDTFEIYETGVRYHFYHVFALLAVGILYASFPGPALRWSGGCFIAGIFLFSGSLYLITALKAAGKAIPMAIGVLTPLGGLCFIVGWVMLLIGLLGKRPA
jgi:uncharacterized membrane protein YgdD (TMEM256/DUF423 family)